MRHRKGRGNATALFISPGPQAAAGAATETEMARIAPRHFAFNLQPLSSA